MRLPSRRSLRYCTPNASVSVFLRRRYFRPELTACLSTPPSCRNWLWSWRSFIWLWATRRMLFWKLWRGMAGTPRCYRNVSMLWMSAWSVPRRRLPGGAHPWRLVLTTAAAIRCDSEPMADSGELGPSVAISSYRQCWGRSCFCSWWETTWKWGLLLKVWVLRWSSVMFLFLYYICYLEIVMESGFI